MEMNVSKYLAFVTTVECGSFTRAAEKLNYSQSGISRMIGDLEHEWSLSLLERGRTGVSLTSDGERLLPYARSLCAEYRRLQMQVDELRGVQSGLIRIGTISSIATHRLPGVIKRFQSSYPGIDYELLLGDYGEIESWVRDGSVDCGFTSLPDESDLDLVGIESDRFMAVLPKGHPLAELDVVPIASLCTESFMLLEKAGTHEISGLFAANGLSPRVHFTTWDDYAIMSMVECGLGVSMLPELILRRNPYDIVIRPTDKTAVRRLGIMLRDRSSSSAALRAFLEAI